jgi:hypothetical protein
MTGSRPRSSRRRDDLTKGGNSVLPSAGLGSQAFGLLFLVGDVPQALLQAGDLAEPLHPLDLSQALAGVGLDFQQPGFPGQVEAEHGAPDAGFSELLRLKPESASRQHDPTRSVYQTLWLHPVEEPEFDVLLASIGGRGIDLVQAVRSVTGLSAWRSKQLLEAVPTTVVDRTWFEAAADAARCLNAVGGRADLVCRWCERVMSPEDCPVDPGPCSSAFLPTTSCPASRPRA